MNRSRAEGLATKSPKDAKTAPRWLLVRVNTVPERRDLPRMSSESRFGFFTFFGAINPGISR